MSGHFSERYPLIIRQKRLAEITGLSRSTIYNLISSGSFPKQISLGKRAVGWLATEVDQWLQERASASRDKGVLE